MLSKFEFIQTKSKFFPIIIIFIFKDGRTVDRRTEDCIKIKCFSLHKVSKKKIW